MLFPIMLDTRQNPQLCMELLRESHLETLNNFTPGMTAVTNEVDSALTKSADDIAHSIMFIRRKLHCKKLEDKVWLNGQNITTS